MELIVVAGSAFGLSMILTRTMRKAALAWGVVDMPNVRSSHVNATPRAGGVGVVVSTTVALLALYTLRPLDWHLLWALTGGGLVVAGIGFMDDRRPLSAGLRLAIHISAAIWAVYLLGGMRTLEVEGHVFELGVVGLLLPILVIVWSINLFNFMDGIDGIAASEAAFISWGAGLISAVVGGCVCVLAPAWIFGAACLGFLVWNWPPAKIFLGDVGSGYLGYVISVLALADHRHSRVSLGVWAILGGVFLVDATATLMRRLMRGERIYEAHRTHAYQWLSRRWRAHRPVTVAVIVIDLAWLLPCAALGALHPEHLLLTASIAILPLVPLMFLIGSGRAEQAKVVSA